MLCVAFFDPATRQVTDFFQGPERLIRGRHHRVPVSTAMLWSDPREYVVDENDQVVPNSARLVLPEDVNKERDRRLLERFFFAGTRFDFDPNSKANITGMAAQAKFGMLSGLFAPTEKRFHGGDEDFVWVSAENVAVPMDAQTVAAFGDKAMEHESQHVMAGRALKDMTTIPSDFQDDGYWP